MARLCSCWFCFVSQCFQNVVWPEGGERASIAFSKHMGFSWFCPLSLETSFGKSVHCVFQTYGFFMVLPTFFRNILWPRKLCFHHVSPLRKYCCHPLEVHDLTEENHCFQENQGFYMSLPRIYFHKIYSFYLFLLLWGVLVGSMFFFFWRCVSIVFSGLIHLSMGDLLRARAKFLPQLQQDISEGRLVRRLGASAGGGFSCL